MSQDTAVDCLQYPPVSHHLEQTAARIVEAFAGQDRLELLTMSSRVPGGYAMICSKLTFEQLVACRFAGIKSAVCHTLTPTPAERASLWLGSIKVSDQTLAATDATLVGCNKLVKLHMQIP